MRPNRWRKEKEEVPGREGLGTEIPPRLVGRLVVGSECRGGFGGPRRASCRKIQNRLGHSTGGPRTRRDSNPSLRTTVNQAGLNSGTRGTFPLTPALTSGHLTFYGFIAGKKPPIRQPQLG